MMDIPDAPWIRKMQNDGEEPGLDYFCPICCKRCETVYTDINGDAVGCDWCITAWPAEDWWDTQHGEE